MVHRVAAKILKAQDDGDGSRDGTYSAALRQIRDGGRKASCWIWWVWPTVAALRPRTSRPQFLLPDVSAVREYLAHPVLRARLLEITEAACTHLEAGVQSVVLLSGTVDEDKFRESLTAFALVAAAAHWEHATAGGRGECSISELSGGSDGGPAAVEDHTAALASVARCCCRALAATRQRTMCEQSVKVLTTAAVGLDERWACQNPWELLQLSGCADAADVPSAAHMKRFGKVAKNPTVPLQRPVKASVVAKNVLVRESAAKASRRVGTLQQGRDVELLELRRTSSGTVRARTDGGWVTVTTSGRGQQLLRTDGDSGALLLQTTDRNEPEPEPDANPEPEPEPGLELKPEPAPEPELEPEPLLEPEPVDDPVAEVLAGLGLLEHLPACHGHEMDFGARPPTSSF